MTAQWLKRVYTRLPVIRELRDIRDALRATSKIQNTIAIESFFKHELAHNPRYRDPRNLNHHEAQVFSQNGEDGIVAEIFRRIGTKDRIFVEVGVGDGLENNTAYLLTQGWRGYWIEGDKDFVRMIRSHFHGPLGEGALTLLNALVDAENVESLLVELGVPKQFDLLSLDIDRNTYHVWKALRRFQPRVAVIEYNATFTPDVEWVANYAPLRQWNQSSYFGASLKSYERLAEELGYALVGCDLTGTNAFFVRTTEKLDLFSVPFTAEHHYEPPRYWSVRRQAHARCFDDN